MMRTVTRASRITTSREVSVVWSEESEEGQIVRNKYIRFSPKGISRGCFDLNKADTERPTKVQCTPDRPLNIQINAQ